MRLATVITADRDAGGGSATRAAVQSGDRFVLLAARDLSELLETAGWQEQAAAAADDAAAGVARDSIPVHSPRFAPVLPRPSKVLLPGLNHAGHIPGRGPEPPASWMMLVPLGARPEPTTSTSPVTLRASLAADVV